MRRTVFLDVSIFVSLRACGGASGQGLTRLCVRCLHPGVPARSAPDLSEEPLFRGGAPRSHFRQVLQGFLRTFRRTSCRLVQKARSRRCVSLCYPDSAWLPRCTNSVEALTVARALQRNPKTRDCVPTTSPGLSECERRKPTRVRERRYKGLEPYWPCAS